MLHFLGDAKAIWDLKKRHTRAHIHTTHTDAWKRKKVRVFLVEKNESIQECDTTTHRPVPGRTTTLCVMENSEKYDSKVFLQNLIINAVSYF